MADISDILSALAQALELERELGVRTVEFDRALLIPTRPVERVSKSIESKSVMPAVSSVPVASVSASKPVEVSRPVEIPKPVVSADVMSIPASAGKASPVRPPFMFVFFSEADYDGAAGVLFDKILAAVGMSRGDVVLALADREFSSRVAAVNPKCVIVMGRNAFRSCFVANSGIRFGTWVTVKGIPICSTHSTSEMVRFSADDPGGLRTMKLLVWKTMQEAMKKIGLAFSPKK